MLELDRKYSIKEIVDLKGFVIVAYAIIDDIYQKVTPTHIKNRCNINDSILSDSEIITISIVGELLTIVYKAANLQAKTAYRDNSLAT